MPADATDSTVQPRPLADALPAPSPIARALMGVVHGYRCTLKPWLGSACRFEPTCSAYALQALTLHGAGRGSLLTLGRLARCHPFCPGGLDPVPPRHGARVATFESTCAAPAPAEPPPSQRVA